MYFDRFDIVAAHYVLLAHYHEGQGSEKYRRLSKILGYFNPGLDVQNNMLNENSQRIYDSLVERELSQGGEA